MGVAVGMILLYFQSVVSDLEAAQKDIKTLSGLLPSHTTVHTGPYTAIRNGFRFRLPFDYLKQT